MNASNATVVVNLHINEPTIAGQHRPARPSWFRRTRSLTVPGARALGWIALGAWLALVSVPAARARVQIVSTLPDYAAIAQAVGGDLVQVTSLARGTEDPHFVEPLPSFVQKLNRADALLEGGVDLEVGWLPT